MALVLRKAVLPRNVSLLKCIKGRTLATTANKNSPTPLAASITKSLRNHLKAVFRMPSFKIEKVSLKKTEASNKQQRCERYGAIGTASCPDLSQPKSHEESAPVEKLHKPKKVAQHNIQRMLSHRLWPYTLSTKCTPYISTTIAGLLDEDPASLRLFDIFGAFACPQFPPCGVPCEAPCKCSKCPDGCYQVTFDTPQVCNGPVCPGTHSGMASPNPNCFPTCPSCGGYCQHGGQCGCNPYHGWGPCGPCGLCCCCAAPNSNANAGQAFYAPCSPEALRNPSQACIGTVLCSNAAPVDCCISGSMPANSDCSHGCGCCCHHSWDSCHSGAYQPSSHYDQSRCHCCCCAAQLALPNYGPDPAYCNNDVSGWNSNSYGYNCCAQHQYDPSWCNYGCGYHNSWGSPCQHYTSYQYTSNAAAAENSEMPSIEAPVCDAELAAMPVEAANPQESAKQPPEPPKCVKNISSPAPDAATACFCPDCTKKPASDDKASIVSGPDETAPKPLPPPRWHGINPTLAKTYPFNSTTRKYHQRTTPVNMARASFSSITPQAIKAADAEPQTKENSDEMEMPQVWSFPASYKRFFESLPTAKTINLRSLKGDSESNEKMRF